MITSVVIPTFNRGRLLLGTVEHILQNGLPKGVVVEIFVVDDGSSTPAEQALSTLVAVPPFALRVLRQENAGPATARNAGFRAAQGRIVLFLDDDILVGPDLVARHLEAHDRFPGSVVFGQCRERLFSLFRVYKPYNFCTACSSSSPLARCKLNWTF